MAGMPSYENTPWFVGRVGKRALRYVYSLQNNDLIILHKVDVCYNHAITPGENSIGQAAQSEELAHNCGT